MMKKTTLLSLLLSFLFSSVIAQDKGEIPISRKLQMAEFLINKLYVDTLDEGKLVEAAIQGMLTELDPHSTYSDPEEVKQFKESIEGQFEGVGIQYQIVQDTLFVIQTISNGPSEKAGVLAGDRIIKVDDTPIAGVNLPTSKIMKLLRGPRKSIVNITVLRRGESTPFTFDIKRDKIPVETIEASHLLNKEVGYIRLNQFGKNSSAEFTEQLKVLKKRGMLKLILDLRGNSGGYLEAAVEIANHFLEAKQEIVSAKGARVDVGDFKAVGHGLFPDNELVILIDEFSASASEIVAGAVQDWDRGVIIGRRSFGKGLVQRPIDLFDGSMIRLTVARYYTPSGRSIQKPYVKGVDQRKEYRMDLINRIEKGELVSQDSIQLVDSLKYHTLLRNRPVYAGGGIMPDLFIPVDTLSVNDYFREVLRSGVLMESSIHYIEKYGDELKERYLTSTEFVRDFKVDNELLSAVEDSSLTSSIENKLASRPQVKRYLKAFVARDLWGLNAFYEVFNQDDPVVLKALEVLDDRSYKKILGFFN